jgi:uncharacterized protein (TIGR03435 family)
MMSMRIEHHPRNALLLLTASMVLLAPTALAQDNSTATKVPDATAPAFEVATVRPTKPDQGQRWMGYRLTNSGRFQASEMSLNSLVWFAYVSTQNNEKVTTDHAVKKWVDFDQFDIQAKIDDQYLNGWNKLSDKQRMDIARPMIRQLLAERFHLKLRTEIQKTPVYVLVQAKGGAHVTEVPPPAPVEGDPMEAQTRWYADNPEKIYPGSIMCGQNCTAKTEKISDAVGQIAMSSQSDRIVIDQTGLNGYYDFSFAFQARPDESPMQEVEESLGVKFEPRSVPTQTYIIESAENRARTEISPENKFHRLASGLERSQMLVPCS